MFLGCEGAAGVELHLRVRGGVHGMGLGVQRGRGHAEVREWVREVGVRRERGDGCSGCLRACRASVGSCAQPSVCKGSVHRECGSTDGRVR